MNAAVGHSPTIVVALSVVLAGAAGALARTFVNDAIAHRTASDFPFGILAVNLLGSFALGLLTGLTWYHGLSADVLTVAGVGLCGGFTTWSTAVWESLALIRLRLFTQAALYTLLGLGAAIGLAASGIAVAALV
jgi:CrcB protein